jgi:hypothetical protein
MMAKHGKGDIRGVLTAERVHRSEQKRREREQRRQAKLQGAPPKPERDRTMNPAHRAPLAAPFADPAAGVPPQRHAGAYTEPPYTGEAP